MTTPGIGQPATRFLPEHCDPGTDLESTIAACVDDCEARGHTWAVDDPGLCVHCGGWWPAGHDGQAAA